MGDRGYDPVSVRGDLSQLSRIAASLRKAGSVQTAQKVASEMAVDYTERARTAFQAGQSVYGDARVGKHGGTPTLYRTGKLFGSIVYRSIGTIVRTVLGVPYARFNIRFGILPRKTLPTAWAEAARKKIGEIINEALA